MIGEKLREIDAHLHKRAPAFWKFIKYRFRRGEEYGLGLTLAFVLVAAALWFFLSIVESVTDQTSLYRFDFRVQAAMTRILSPDRTQWVVFITTLGNTLGITILVGLFSLFLIAKRHWWDFFGLVFASAGGGLVLRGIKAFFQRARPTERLVEAAGYSFPSGHAFGSMVFFGYLIYIIWHHYRHRHLAWRLLATFACGFLILLIGSSRVYLNVHWLTDVLGGFLSGFIWLVSSVLIVRAVERRRIRQVAVKEE